MADSRLLYEPEQSVSERWLAEVPPEAAFKSKPPPKADEYSSAQTPRIEYVAGQWVVVQRRRGVPSERRCYHAMRKHIDTLLDQGWSITGRDPVRLERFQQVKIVKGGVLIDG